MCHRVDKTARGAGQRPARPGSGRPQLSEALSSPLSHRRPHALTSAPPRCRIKCERRAAHYAPRAADPSAPPTLADILAPVATDAYDKRFFSDFPVPLRPVHDFLCELQRVDEMPVLLAVDGWNRFEQMSSCKKWRSPEALHARQLLVPSLLGDVHAYGGGMARGLMLCGLTFDSAAPPSVPRGLRKKWAQPTAWHAPQTLPDEQRRLVRAVPPYSQHETQQTLDFYAHVGHIQNRDLAPQLYNGKLMHKVHLMTAGVADDVFTMCESM